MARPRQLRSLISAARLVPSAYDVVATCRPPAPSNRLLHTHRHSLETVQESHLLHCDIVRLAKVSSARDCVAPRARLRGDSGPAPLPRYCQLHDEGGMYIPKLQAPDRLRMGAASHQHQRHNVTLVRSQVPGRYFVGVTLRSSQARGPRKTRGTRCFCCYFLHSALTCAAHRRSFPSFSPTTSSPIPHQPQVAH